MNNLKLQKGTALLMTILILNVIIIISLAAAKLVVSGVKMSGTQAKSTKAFFAAETGAEKALWLWRKNGSFSPLGCDNNNVTGGFLPNASSYQVICTSTASTFVKIKSSGSFSGLNRSVELELNF